jgi:outer membrane biogenesis lipoprotein LolB
MSSLLILKRTILVLMLGLATATLLSACTIDTDWRHDNADHSDLYR